ncbi:MAG: RNA polymerase sigma factor SigZ [Negativicutes bacterium]
MDKNTQALWEEMRLPLQRFIARRIQNEHDAEDLLQNIFCKIHDRIDDLRDETKVHAWVYQIARNSIIDYYRAQKNSSELTDVPDDVIAAESEPDLSLEVAGCIKTIIDNMPEKYRGAIVMTEFEEISQKALAERLGLSLSGAKSRVQRGRAKLRELLLGCCHVDFDRRGNIVDYRRKRASCKYC